MRKGRRGRRMNLLLVSGMLAPSSAFVVSARDLGLSSKEDILDMRIPDNSERQVNDVVLSGTGDLKTANARKSGYGSLGH